MTSRIPREMNNQFIRTAFDRCPSGLLIVDARGEIVVVNAEVERLFGYTRDELLGRSVETLIPERFASGHAAHRAEYAKTPSARPMGAGRELYARHRDGHEIPVEVGLSTIEGDDGLYVLSTIVDVTERRRLEERLRQTHKLEAVGNLASGIAHDFNNILLGIMGYAELVRDAVDKDETVLEDLNVVIDSARRGRDLVGRILSFTRQSEPKRTHTHLAGPIHEAVQLLTATLPSNIEIRNGCDPSTPPIIADAMELHQVVMNLATNAAHSMKVTGGTLQITAAPVTVDGAMVARHPELHPGLYARLLVSDTGTGIAAEHLPRIFDPFYTTKPTGEGTGLGLSVLSRIVRSLEGCVVVDSTLGKGTTFEVLLPAAVGSSASTDVDAADEKKRCHVLLVEDEEHLGKLGKRILERIDMRVEYCPSSLQAFEVFRSNPQRYQLVITDNTMPHMTGLQLVSKIREVRSDIPIMMVSGIGDSMSVDELHKLGVDRLLSKPYAAADLRAAATELVKTTT
ncbi:MAG: PAS domain S-box protein [Polyangiaceae bacterium]